MNIFVSIQQNEGDSEGYAELCVELENHHARGYSMFRANSNRYQQSTFDATTLMTTKNSEALKRSWAHFFYEDVFLQIDERPYAALFAQNGRPNFPVNILLCLEFIKQERNCSDLELLDAFHFDFLVNYALGIRNIGEIDLSIRTLYYFRKRIYLHFLEHPGGEDLLFGQFQSLLNVFATKAEISLKEQRVDTTLFSSNIKKSGRLSLAHDVLVNTVKTIPEGLLTESLAKVLEPGFKNNLLYRAKATDDDSRLATLLDLCAEAMQLLNTLPDDFAVDAKRVAKRFLDEQSTEDPATGKRIARPKAEITYGSLQSAYDEDATFRRKGDKSQSGYLLGLTETCSDDNPFQLITAATVAPYNISDQEILQVMLPDLKNEFACTDVYGDGGFYSEETLQVAKENEIELHFTNMSGTEPSKRLAVSEFDIEPGTERILHCPKGYVPTVTGLSKGQTVAHFARETCLTCELFDRCHSKAQKKDCVVRISLTSVLASRERQKMQANRVENTSMRAAIEGTNSALKRKGLAKLNVRGGLKSALVSCYKVIAQNINRYIRYRLGAYRPKKEKRPSMGLLCPNMGSGG